MSLRKLALKINVDTLRGARVGVPHLIELLQKHGAQATFFFALGKDNTGLAPRHKLPRSPKGQKGITRRERYGFAGTLYGSWLPAPDLGKHSAHLLRAVHEAGFDTAIHSWDRVLWQKQLVQADKATNEWVEVEMAKAAKRYETILGQRPTAHGAAGWQMNRHALRLTQRLGLSYASDTRGTSPFLPVVEGEAVTCPQLPTTLPTMDELVGQNGITDETVADRLLALTHDAPAAGHLFTAHAELEGGKLLAQFDKLLEGWKAQGYELISCRQLAEGLDKGALPRCQVIHNEVPGRAGALLVQGPEFLAA